jgi:predicted nucleic acid-binding Zn ribbon protein
MDRLGGGTTTTTLATLFGHWEAIAGTTLAPHVRPVRLHGGTLVVAADHPAWATKVRSLGAQLLDRVGEQTGARPARLDVVVRSF